jgi:hypothetical protein
MKIDTKKLASDDQVEYTQEIEYGIARLLMNLADYSAPTSDHNDNEFLSDDLEMFVTGGCNHNYDFKIGNATFELKCSANRNLMIEAKSNFERSGILKSQADFYVMVNKGSNSKGNDIWEDVNKLRIIPRSELLETIMDNGTPLQLASNGYGFYELNPKEDLTDDGWIADLSLEDSTPGKRSTKKVTQLHSLFRYPHLYN